MATICETAKERLRARLTRAKLKKVRIPDTQEYALYADDDQNETMFPYLDKEVTPDVSDEYVHVSVMLPCGSQMIHSTVRAHKRDLDGNPIGH